MSEPRRGQRPSSALRSLIFLPLFGSVVQTPLRSLRSPWLIRPAGTVHLYKNPGEKPGARCPYEGTPVNDAQPESFEQALVELERIVRDLEDGKTGLEDALARYEQGVALLKRCYGQLNRAEQRISELVGQDSAGNAVTRPFEHVAAVEVARDKRNGS